MPRFLKLSVLMAALTLCLFSETFAQKRIAIFPFLNMDGDMKYNPWMYKLQDSLTKYFQASDPEEYNYRVVPQDSVEAILASLNLDPMNPQYQSDMWKAVDALNVERVIIGNFNIQAGKFLINAYIYDPTIKLPDPRYQAKDIFKSEDKIYECIPIITKRLRPAVL